MIVDTFQRFRGEVSGNRNLYGADYNDVGALKKVADRFGVAIVCVHHTRKAGADDPLDTVSGTNGISGAADATCTIGREIGRADAFLYIRGRDVEEAEYAIDFDKQSYSWTLKGEAAEYRLSQERQAVVDLLASSADSMSPKEIAEALGKSPGAVRKLLPTMVRDGQILGAVGKYGAIRPQVLAGLAVEDAA